MDIIGQILIMICVATVSTVVTVRILIAELNRDVMNLKEAIKAVKEERKDDLYELRRMIKESIDERNRSYDKIYSHIEEMQSTLTQIKVDIAKQSR